MTETEAMLMVEEIIKRWPNPSLSMSDRLDWAAAFASLNKSTLEKVIQASMNDRWRPTLEDFCSRAGHSSSPSDQFVVWRGWTHLEKRTRMHIDKLTKESTTKEIFAEYVVVEKPHTFSNFVDAKFFADDSEADKSWVPRGMTNPYVSEVLKGK